MYPVAAGVHATVRNDHEQPPKSKGVNIIVSTGRLQNNNREAMLQDPNHQSGSQSTSSQNRKTGLGFAKKSTEMSHSSSRTGSFMV